MALFHRATITPTKAELIAEWVPTRPWGPSASEAVEVTGSYRFDDPDGRWYVAPSNVRIQGGGWSQERVAVDGFELVADDAAASVLRNDRFELTMFRRPARGPRPDIGLTATWEVHDPVVLAELREQTS